MRHFSFFLLFTALLLTSSARSQRWETVGGESYEAIAGLSDGSLVMLRYPGDILRSTDGALTWHIVYHRLLPLTAIQALPTEEVIARGNGDLLLSRDSGRNWVGVDSSDDPHAYNALITAGGERGPSPRRAPHELVTPNGAHLMLDDSSNILLSHDNGASWRRVFPLKNEYPCKLHGVALAGGVCYSVGEPGLIYASDSMCTHWRQLHTAPFQVDTAAHRNYSCIDFFSAASGAIAAGNRMYITRDSGTTWSETTLADTDSVSSVVMLSDTTVLAGGPRGLHQFGVLNPISFAGNAPVLQMGWVNKDAGSLFILTDSSIYFSDPSLEQPVQQLLSLTPGEHARAASFPNKYIGYLLTDSATRSIDSTADSVILRDTCSVYRTTDGGGTWSQILHGAPGLRKIFFSSPEHGFVCGESAGRHGNMHYTEDSGSTWPWMVFPSRHTLHDVRFINDSMGYAVGDSGTVVAARSRGRWWRAVPPEPSFRKPLPAYTSIAFADSKTVYVLGQNRLFRQHIPDPMAPWRFRRRSSPKITLRVAVIPNPSAGSVRITVTSGNSQPTAITQPTLSICDLSGRVILHEVEISTEGSNTWSGRAELSDFPPGVYVAIASAGGASARCNFVVAR